MVILQGLGGTGGFPGSVRGLRAGELDRKRVAHLHGVGALGHPRGHLQLLYRLLGLL